MLLPTLALAQGNLPDCVHVRAEARWGAAAYNHIVVVENTCGSLARCQVATNVNPERTRVDVPPGQTREVVTFRGSPARVFTPRVSCELER